MNKNLDRLLLPKTSSWVCLRSSDALVPAGTTATLFKQDDLGMQVIDLVGSCDIIPEVVVQNLLIVLVHVALRYACFLVATASMVLEVQGSQVHSESLGLEIWRDV